MKRMAKRDPLIHLPDDSFIYADDLTRLTWREVASLVVGVVVVIAFVWAVFFLIGLASA